MHAAVAGPAAPVAVSPERSRPGAALLRRFGSAVVLVPGFVWIVMRAPGWVFALLVLAVGLGALWELMRLFERTGQAVYHRLGLGLGTAVLAAFAVPVATDAALVPPVAVVVLTVALGALLAAPVWSGAAATEPVALAILATVYIGWFLGHALPLHRLPDGAALVLVLVGVVWIGETAAYAVGSLLGRRPLAPVISPRKTVEGALAQLAVSVTAAVVLGPVWLLPGWSVAYAAGAGALVGVVAQVGDLAESALKRSAGVKDAGSLLPGHGGVLDRIDGLLFGVPAFYYYVRLGGGA